MPGVAVACPEADARWVRRAAEGAYEEARVRCWPFLSDVLERALRDVSEDDRAAVVAVTHALTKYDRLLGFVATGEGASARFDALAALAWQPQGETASSVEARLSNVSSDAERLGIRFSFPTWLVARIGAELGQAALERALARMNESPPRVVRVNTTAGTREACIEALEREGIVARPATYAPEALVVEGTRSPFRGRAFASGAFEFQDEASQLVAHLVAPPPRGLVVDACAGAGGKTLALAALLGGKGRVVGIDASKSKIEELRRRARRAAASQVQGVVADLLAPAGPELAMLEGRAARVLVDAPCTGLGAIRRNPEARWRLQEADLDRLATMQRALTHAALRLVAPRGRLIYATCSFLPSESEAVVDAVARERPSLVAVTARDVLGRARTEALATRDGRFLRTWRFDDAPDGGDAGMDGFFGAVFRAPDTGP